MGEQTIAQYVSKGIEKLFLDVAEMVGTGEIKTDDDFHPLEIFAAQTQMLNAWERYQNPRPSWLRLILEAYQTHDRICDLVSKHPRKQADDQLTRLQTASWFRLWRRLRSAYNAHFI